MITKKFVYHFIFYLAICSVLSIDLKAQKQFNVLDWETDISLNAYLVRQMKQQYALRKEKLEDALTSKESTLRYVEETRKKCWSLLGGAYKKSKLHVKSTGIIRLDSVSIEKIVYESFPGHHVTANLYLPKGKGPFPAAIFFCGHEDMAKATISYQKTAILFATNGFVVLLIDPVSQSERYQLTDETGHSLTRGGSTEHTLLNQASNLFGLSTPEDELLDNLRGLDYLVTRKEVDTARIGCLGHSGGGMQSIFFGAYEPRIKVTAVSSFLMNREMAMETTGPFDGCSHIPNEGKLGLEMSDYLIAAVPRPLLVIAGRYDFINFSGTMVSFREIQKVYNSLKQPEKINLFAYDDGHDFSQPKREAAVNWFRKWLTSDTAVIKEYELNTLTEKDLQATRSGQVEMDYPKEVSIYDRNGSLYKTTATKRKKFLKKDEQQVIKDIRELMNIETVDAPVDVKEPANVISNHITFRKLILRKENEVPLPALMVFPDALPKKVIVWLYENGKNQLADSAVFLRSYLKQQSAIILADLRGMGETEDRASLNDPKYYNKEYRNAMLALHNGQSLMCQRVTDILTLIQYIQSVPQLKGLPIEMHASGAASVPAIHAVLFNKNISSLYLYGAMHSYQNMLENPFGKNWYSNVMAGVLNYYDLPDIIRLISPRKISFIEMASASKSW